MRARVAVIGAMAVVIGGAVWLFARSSDQAEKPEGAMSPSTALPSVSAIAKHVDVGAQPQSGETPSIGASKTPDEWNALFAGAQDYQRFVEQAEPAATRGDARAAYYLSKAYGLCTPVYELYLRKDGDSRFDPRREFEDRVAKQMFVTESIRDAQRANFARCRQLAETAAAKMKTKSEYPSEKWKALALERKDPLARAAQVEIDLSKLGNSSSGDKADTMNRINQETLDIVKAKDPQAMFLLGFSRRNRNGEDGIAAVALALAACDLGADCFLSHSNFVVIQQGVEVSGQLSYQDWLRSYIGASSYDRAFARAQELNEMIRREDWDGVKGVLELDN